MTSTSSSNSAARIYVHAFIQALIQSFAVAALGLLAFLLIIPVSTAAIPGSSIFDVEYTHNQMKYRFYHESLTLLLHGAVILFGIALGVSLFRYMLSKRSSDAFFAMGIARWKQLAVRFGAGVIYLAVGLVIPLLVSLFMNISAFGELGYTGVAVSGFEYMFAGLFTLGLVSFTISALVSCMVGTIAEAAAFSAVAIAAPSILLYSVNSLAKQLLFGNSFGLSTSSGSVEVSSNLVSLLDRFNPALFFYEAAKAYCAQYVRLDGYVLPARNGLLVAVWIVIALVIMALAGLALYKRKAEIAGVSGTSRILNFAVTFLLSFLGFSTVVDFAASIGVLPALVTAAAVFVALYVILELLQKNGLRGLRKGIVKLPIQLGSVLAAVLILITGGFGYAGRIPDLEEIESVEMTYAGSPNYLGGQISGMSSGDGYYVMSSYSFDSEKDVKTVMDLHRTIIDAGKGKLELNNQEFAKTTVPYDIVIRYKLKDGGNLTRYYDRTSMEALSQLLVLDETDKVEEAMRNTIANPENAGYGAAAAYRNGLVYLNNSWYANPQQVLFTPEQRNELLACIADDVALQSAEDRYFPKQPPLGVIMFTQNGGEEAMQFSYRLENTLVFITPSFTNTIQYLQDTGLYDYLSFGGEIESITFQAYNPYVGINKNKQPKSQYFIGYTADNPYSYIQKKDFGKDLVIDDPQQVAELSGLLQNVYYMSDGGYLACVKLKDSSRYVYKFLPQAAAPDYVRKKAS